MLTRSWRTLSALAGGVALLSVVTLPGSADILYLFSEMNGANEVPPVATNGTGVGNMKVDTDLDTVDFVITFQNLSSNENAAHFHGPAAAGQNGGIAFVLPTGSPKVGVWNYPNIDEATVVGDLFYTNLHTTTFPGGEIRGQNVVTAESVCWGDGSGTVCPCSNPGTKGRGCANSTGDGGLLEPSGSNSVSSDDMSFHASNLLPNQPGLLFVGNTLINGGNGAVFGDGLRCAGTAVQRLGTMSPDAAGDASWGPGLGTLGGWSAGDSRHIQCWYRNPGGPCGSAFNLTNALSVTFTP